MKKIVIALGGNALETKGESATAASQFKSINATMSKVVDIISAGNHIVLTHGNGPQVGRLILQNKAAEDITPAMPMDMLDAATQGMIGYQIQRSLQHILQNHNIDTPVCTVITQVLVDPYDKAFENPDKPVGPFYSREECEIKKKETNYHFREDSGRGYRRVVPSPKPLGIVEMPIIRKMYDDGIIVIATGGGGIPVVDQKDDYHTVEAVIDKDRASSLLADQLNADLLIILTNVSNVYLNYGKDDQKQLGKISCDTIEHYAAEGHFYAGSMFPKIEACVNFVKGHPNRKAIITTAELINDAIEGRAGTIILHSYN